MVNSGLLQPPPQMEHKLNDAASAGRVIFITELLQGNPEVDVNWRNPTHFGWTALHRACWTGKDEVVEVLLAHPKIDVDPVTEDGSTPLWCAFRNAHPSCLRLLLRDPRMVDVNRRNRDGHTPFFWVGHNGHMETIKVWIASGRKIDLGEPGGPNDAIAQARKFCREDIAEYLERFKENPERVRYEVMVEFGLHAELAAQVFAVVVFLSDGLLQPVASTGRERSNAGRFLAIASQLPLELQVILCCRTAGTSRNEIQTKDSEEGFRNLAHKYTARKVSVSAASSPGKKLKRKPSSPSSSPSLSALSSDAGASTSAPGLFQRTAEKLFPFF